MATEKEATVTAAAAQCVICHSKRSRSTWYYQGTVCTTCYLREWHRETKYLRTEWKIPWLYQHYTRMVRAYDRVLWKPSRTPKKPHYFYKPKESIHGCHEQQCVDQREQVRREHYGMKYSDKFQHYRRCRHCRTFWPRAFDRCPCCNRPKMQMRVSLSHLRKNRPQMVVEESVVRY